MMNCMIQVEDRKVLKKLIFKNQHNKNMIIMKKEDKKKLIL